MVKITHPRGQWTAKVAGMGTVPVVSSSDLQDDRATVIWQTRDARDAALAQRQFDAVVSQLTASNPERKVHAVVVDTTDMASSAVRRLFEFTLANVKVNHFVNGSARYNYLLTDGQEIA